MLLIPIGLDKDEVRRTPWVSYCLIAVNVAVFVWEWIDVSGGGSPLHRWGYVPGASDPLRVFTSMFLHAGVLHLAGNMLFFFVSGPFVEDAYGRVVFLLLYLCSGAVAAAVHGSMNPDSLVPMVGASGAIAGVMGAFLIRLAGRRIRFFWMPLAPLPWLSRQISIPAFVFLPLWFVGQLFFAGLTDGQGVAFFAHIGGFAFGAVFAIVVAATGLERRWIHPAIEAQIGYKPDDELLRAIEERERGNLVQARSAIGRILARKPKDVDARRLAYEIALQENDSEAIARHAPRLLDLYIDSGETDLARRLIGEAAHLDASALPARFLLRAGDFTSGLGEGREAQDFYRQVYERFPTDPIALRALVQTADLSRKSRDLAACRRFLQRGLDHPACAGQWKEVFETKLAALAAIAGATTSTGPGYRGGG